MTSGIDCLQEIAGNEIFGHDEIQIEDGLLTMPGVIGLISPISET